MGLILDARSSLYLESVAYGKRGLLLWIRAYTLDLLSWKIVLFRRMQTLMLCRRSQTRPCSGDDYQIESSTDFVPV